MRMYVYSPALGPQPEVRDGRDWEGPLPWNTRANDTESIVDVSFGLFDSPLRGHFYGLPPRLVNLLSLVRLRTSPHSQRYGVTITGLLVTVFPAGHPRYGDARATHSSWSQLSSLLCHSECLHVHAPFSWQTLFTASSYVAKINIPWPWPWPCPGIIM
jgi:hypothetical protein